MYGTRPEAIKLWKVVDELRLRGVEPNLVQTGQHTSLLRGTPAENSLKPNVSLDLESHNAPNIYARLCVKALAKVFKANRPELIVVQGDTASAYAGAVTGKTLGIPVAHVEAGVRTGDPWDPWPEENFRVSIDQIATWLFCATRSNFLHFTDALKSFEVQGSGPLSALADYPLALNHPSSVRTTGNPGIDALYSHTRPVEHPHKVQDRVLITLHRRESFEGGAHGSDGWPMQRIVDGIWAGAKKYPKIEFVWPTHPNPKVQACVPYETLPNLLIQGPMEMVPFAQMLAASRAVISDSGGVQEEAAALGIPCIVAREKTDRPESVDLGLAKVVGRTEAGILQGLDWALGFGARCTPSDCFGDGHSSGRIVSHLLGD